MQYLLSLSSFAEKAITNGKVFEFSSDVSSRISTEILNIFTEGFTNVPNPSMKITH